MHGWMTGLMDERMDGWMDGLIDRWMDNKLIAEWIVA